MISGLPRRFAPRHDELFSISLTELDLSAPTDRIAGTRHRAFAIDQPPAVHQDHLQRLLRRVTILLGGVDLAEIDKCPIFAVHPDIQVEDFDANVVARVQPATPQLRPVFTRQPAVRRKGRRVEARIVGVILGRPGCGPGLDLTDQVALRSGRGKRRRTNQPAEPPA